MKCSKTPFPFRMGKSNLAIFLEKIGNPHQKIKTVNIVGTNGKGTTSFLLTKQLISNNLRVGTFTSPAFLNHNERIKVDNKMISDREIRYYYRKHKKLINKCNLMFFDVWLVIAIQFFIDKKIDIAIIEAGIGGVRDATNVFSNQIATILTSISYDHTELLGNNIESIITNKIGIAKQNNKIFVSPSNRQYFNFIYTQNKNAFLSSLISGISAKIDIGKDINKIDNMSVVVNFLRYFNYKIDWNLFSIKETEHNLGRFSIIQKNPFYIIDGAHNEGAITNLVKNIKNLNLSDVTIIFATSKGKNWKKMISILENNFSSVKICSFKHIKSWNVKKIDSGNTSIIPNWKKFIIQNKSQNLIFCGSLYFVPLVYKFLQKKFIKHQ